MIVVRAHVEAFSLAPCRRFQERASPFPSQWTRLTVAQVGRLMPLLTVMASLLSVQFNVG